MQNEAPSQPNAEEVGVDASGKLLGAETAKYLDDKASESFKRQIDLEESIWRSLPLFTGALIAAAALLAKVASYLPLVEIGFFPILSYGLLLVSAVIFGGAFWWLWQVVKPRDYDFPAGDQAISEYARGLNGYYADQGLSEEALDKIVLAEMRLYMTQSFAKASKSAFEHNQARLSARSQVLILLISGFVLSFLAGSVIFGHNVVFPHQKVELGRDGRDSKSESASGGGRENSGAATAGRAAIAPANEGHQRRWLVNQDQHSRPVQGKVSEQRRKTAKFTTDSCGCSARITARGPSDAAVDEDRTGSDARISDEPQSLYQTGSEAGKGR